MIAFREQALAVFLAMGILAFAKMLDAFARLFPFMADFHTDNRPLFGLIEESFELTSVLFFAYVCAFYFIQQRR